MPSNRPLPTVIGPTENALRALLVQTLAGTEIDSYHSWVVINALDFAEKTHAGRDWRTDTADALKIEPRELDAVLDRLRASHLVDGDSLTDAGRAELHTARSAVAETTSRLVNGLDPDDQEVARRVLDHIRRSAEAMIAA